MEEICETLSPARQKSMMRFQPYMPQNNSLRAMYECLPLIRPPNMLMKTISGISHRHSICTVPTPATYFFSSQDLDMVLLGYATGPNSPNKITHALTGLRISEISHGIERIMSHRGENLGLTSLRFSRNDPPPVDLPEDICILPSSFLGVIHYGVFCSKDNLSQGMKFGPFKGKIVNTSEIKSFDDNSHMWEIFKDGRLSHFIDGRGSAGNWMSYINCARHKGEQNLVVVQKRDDIYYETCKTIHQGVELLVWYGDDYLQFMGIPVTLKDTPEHPHHALETDNKNGYPCERCGKVFAYKYYRDKHLKYTKCVDQGNRKFPCHLCPRSFEKRDRLRIHILHVHEKHRPHKCTVCSKSFSQSSSLNKHMRVHSGERPYKCVYCSKAFTASSILRTHIRQHSGERPFKCKFCGKAFASHAAHDSHVRRTHAREKLIFCNICKQEFSNQYDFKLHQRTHHNIGNNGTWDSPITFPPPVESKVDAGP